MLKKYRGVKLNFVYIPILIWRESDLKESDLSGLNSVLQYCCIFSFLLTCWYSYESLLYYRQRLWFNVFVSKFNSFNNLLVLYRIWFIKDLGWGLKALQHYLPMSILLYKVSTGLLMSNFRKKICAGTFLIELHMYRKH